MNCRTSWWETCIQCFLLELVSMITSLSSCSWSKPVTMLWFSISTILSHWYWRCRKVESQICRRCGFYTSPSPYPTKNHTIDTSRAWIVTLWKRQLFHLCSNINHGWANVAVVVAQNRNQFILLAGGVCVCWGITPELPWSDQSRSFYCHLFAYYSVKCLNTVYIHLDFPQTRSSFRTLVDINSLTDVFWHVLLLLWWTMTVYNLCVPGTSYHVPRQVR